MKARHLNLMLCIGAGISLLVSACGAGRRVADAEGLARAVVEELREPEVAARRGRAGRQVLDEHSGAARRSADLVEELLRDGGAP